MKRRIEKEVENEYKETERREIKRMRLNNVTGGQETGMALEMIRKKRDNKRIKQRKRQIKQEGENT